MHCFISFDSVETSKLFCIGRCIIIIIFFYLSLYVYTPCFHILNKNIIITIIKELAQHEVKAETQMSSYIKETSSASVYMYE